MEVKSRRMPAVPRRSRRRSPTSTGRSRPRCRSARRCNVVLCSDSNAERIEDYISHFYQKYEGERKGLGFVMTVYRRRLTSSFYAMERSLERRLAFLRGEGTLAGLDEDDIEQADLDEDVTEELEETDRRVFQGEISYVEDFLHELRQLQGDSKFERLCDDLGSVFQRRETVVIFTQYADTMDYLRDKLRAVYGGQVACYSGRGGEYWNGLTWVETTKEKIKNQFREGVVKILVCTEAASEGLNLQTCGVLINYDMPWNPMRVEQRIGRIDRIGQVHQEVWVNHFFYEGTVEANVYHRLSDRIGWFENVVGELQPILARVSRIIEQVALSRREEREQRLEQALSSLRAEIEERQLAELNLDQYASQEPKAAPETQSPVTLSDLESALVSSDSVGQFFRPHPTIDGAYLLSYRDDETAVTFRRDVFDQHPSSVRLMTYGEELFATLLDGVEEPETETEGTVVKVAVESDPVRAYGYSARRAEGIEPIPDLTALQKALDMDQTVLPAEVEPAKTLVEQAVRALLRGIREAERRRRDSAYTALQEMAREALLRAAYLDLALAQQPELGEEGFAAAFSAEAVMRLGRRRYPFSGLLKLVTLHGLRLSPTAREYLELTGASPEALRAKFETEKQRAAELLDKLAGWGDAQPAEVAGLRTSVRAFHAPK